MRSALIIPASRSWTSLTLPNNFLAGVRDAVPGVPGNKELVGTFWTFEIQSAATQRTSIGVRIHWHDVFPAELSCMLPPARRKVRLKR
jgi:hypothetical protein